MVRLAESIFFGDQVVEVAEARKVQVCLNMRQIVLCWVLLVKDLIACSRR